RRPDTRARKNKKSTIRPCWSHRAACEMPLESGSSSPRRHTNKRSAPLAPRPLGNTRPTADRADPSGIPETSCKDPRAATRESRPQTRESCPDPNPTSPSLRRCRLLEAPPPERESLATQFVSSQLSRVNASDQNSFEL